jgi:hypothetical protein
MKNRTRSKPLNNRKAIRLAQWSLHSIKRKPYQQKALSAESRISRKRAPTEQQTGRLFKPTACCIASPDRRSSQRVCSLSAGSSRQPPVRQLNQPQPQKRVARPEALQPWCLASQLTTSTSSCSSQYFRPELSITVCDNLLTDLVQLLAGQRPAGTAQRHRKQQPLFARAIFVLVAKGLAIGN